MGANGQKWNYTAAEGSLLPGRARPFTRLLTWRTPRRQSRAKFIVCLPEGSFQIGWIQLIGGNVMAAGVEMTIGRNFSQADVDISEPRFFQRLLRRWRRRRLLVLVRKILLQFK